MSQGVRAIGLLCLMLVLVFGVAHEAWAEETADLSFTEAHFRDAYLEVAGVWGLEIGFDSKFRGGEFVTMEMRGVTALGALDRLALAGDHAILVSAGGDLIVMDDTPQNRRTYETLEIATFAPEFLPAKDFDQFLRSLIEARRVAVDDEHGTVMLRATREKICVAKKIIEVIDTPPAEIDLDVRVIKTEGAYVGVDPNRMTEDEFRDLTSRRESTFLASFGMTLVGSSQASIEMPAPSDLPGAFSLRVYGNNHFGTDDLTLTYQFDWSRAFMAGSNKRSERFHHARQVVRLSLGETVVVPLEISTPESAMILTLRPTLIRPSALDVEMPDPIAAGTEARISCAENRALEEALRGAHVVRDPVPVVRPAAPPRIVAPGRYDGRPGSGATMAPARAVGWRTGDQIESDRTPTPGPDR